MGKEGYGKLEHEWNMYSAIAEKKLDGLVIPQCLGLSRHRNFSVLVTEYAGECVVEFHKLAEADRCILIYAWQLAYSSLHNVCRIT